MSDSNPTTSPLDYPLPKMRACPKCGCEDIFRMSMTAQQPTAQGAQYFVDATSGNLEEDGNAR